MARRRTLFLGAGASEASQFALPVMSEFFGDDLQLFKELSHFLQRWPTEDLNLESVMVHLDLSRRRAERSSRNMRDLYSGFYQRAYDDCLEYVERRLSIPENQVDGLHRRLFATLESGENVLSTNYDLVADQALADVERGREDGRWRKVPALVSTPIYAGGPVPPTLIPHEMRGGWYVKLHGSLDWLRCSTEGCSGSKDFYAARQSVWAIGVVTPCRYCGAFVEPAILPPKASKSIDDRGKFSFLWSIAMMSLQWADEWVFVGSSIPESDYDVAWLLREARSNGKPFRATVVNPDKTACDRVRKILSPRAPPIDHFESIDAYLNSMDA